MGMDLTAIIEAVEAGPARRFSDWPDGTLPKGPPGCYTIWVDDVLIYVGIARTDASETTNPQAAGLWGRLATHARGGRAGHLMTYICDRFVIPDLTVAELEDLRAGRMTLGTKVNEFLRSRVTYRAAICTRPEAEAVENLVRRTGLPHAGKPLLNSISQ